LFRIHSAGLLIAILFLTGCSSMPVTTMYKLSRLEPLEADPAQIRVAVRADERIGIREGGVHIDLTFDADDGSLQVDETYIVEIIRDPVITPELFRDMAPGTSITVLQLSESDARRMREVQSLLARNKEHKGRASLGVGLSGICFHGPVPENEILLDIYMQTSNDDEFFVFTRSLDLREQFDRAGADFEQLPACESGPVS
jgi:hypothetical protein